MKLNKKKIVKRIWTVGLFLLVIAPSNVQAGTGSIQVMIFCDAILDSNNIEKTDNPIAWYDSWEQNNYKDIFYSYETTAELPLIDSLGSEDDQVWSRTRTPELEMAIITLEQEGQIKTICNTDLPRTEINHKISQWLNQLQQTNNTKQSLMIFPANVNTEYLTDYSYVVVDNWMLVTGSDYDLGSLIDLRKVSLDLIALVSILVVVSFIYLIIRKYETK